MSLHPDTEVTLSELLHIPAFRAQVYGAGAKGIDTKQTVSDGLHKADALLQSKGAAFFQKHPELEEAPYGFFLRFNPETSLHDVTVQVGNEAMIAERQVALAIVCHGKIQRNLIK